MRAIVCQRSIHVGDALCPNQGRKRFREALTEGP